MYLKALEIQGFKSFPDKTVLSFGEDITAIVGPNGSGKSNISDAIRWVMGEQSTKALRGGKMEDVIFGGTALRKQQGFAEVSLVLDNTDHIFPMEESEVMLTRRYYRSGESEYYINRRSVRLKDVNELFMDTGLGREGYSIIGQGRIDEILSVKSGDRREIFEEAAGISRFRHRKEEAERKLERTQENLVRITDKIDELELQVEPLRQQSETARQVLILRDELRGLEISLWLDQLEKIRSASRKTLSDYENALRQKGEVQQQVEDLYAAAEAFSAQMRDKDVETEGVRFQMMQREADANGLENAIAVLKTNIQNNLENRDRIQRELEQQEGRADSIAAQIGERKTRLEELEGQSVGLRQQLADRQKEAASASRSAGAIAQELEHLRRKEAVENASAADAKALISALAAAVRKQLVLIAKRLSFYYVGKAYHVEIYVLVIQMFASLGKPADDKPRLSQKSPVGEVVGVSRLTAAVHGNDGKTGGGKRQIIVYRSYIASLPVETKQYGIFFFGRGTGDARAYPTAVGRIKIQIFYCIVFKLNVFVGRKFVFAVECVNIFKLFVPKRVKVGGLWHTAEIIA